MLSAETIVCFVCLYAILVLCSSITSGMANMLTICQAAFWGIGAYFSAIVMEHYSSALVIIVLPFVTMLVSGLSSLLVSYASIKLKGDSFVLASIAFQMIVFNIIKSWEKVTDGEGGMRLTNITNSFDGFLKDNDYYWILFLIVTVLIIVLYLIWQRSPYGRLLRAINSDDNAMEVLGKNVKILKIRTFFVSAALSGLAGLLFAVWRKQLVPAQFGLSESILVITALFIGGKKRWIGALVGVAIVMVLPRLFIKLSEVGIRGNYQLASLLCNAEQVLYGLTLIVMAFFRPQGIFGSKRINTIGRDA